MFPKTLGPHLKWVADSLWAGHMDVFVFISQISKYCYGGSPSLCLLVLCFFPLGMPVRFLSTWLMIPPDDTSDAVIFKLKQKSWKM